MLLPMRCIVTAGPTYEPLDKVRRLTNFSTGRLGSELANYLAERGHEVTLLIGEQATWHGEPKVAKVLGFGTTASLKQKLQSLSGASVDGVFHAAAVSDFGFGKIFHRSPDGATTELCAGKLSTRQGTVFAELLPTSKLILELRDWFPRAVIVGWKYEVDGDRGEAVRLAERQIREARINACVANGPAYGEGFGLVRAGGARVHLAERGLLYDALGQMLSSPKTA